MFLENQNLTRIPTNIDNGSNEVVKGQPAITR